MHMLNHDRDSVGRGWVGSGCSFVGLGSWVLLGCVRLLQTDFRRGAGPTVPGASRLRHAQQGWTRQGAKCSLASCTIRRECGVTHSSSPSQRLRDKASINGWVNVLLCVCVFRPVIWRRQIHFFFCSMSWFVLNCLSFMWYFVFKHNELSHNIIMTSFVSQTFQ